MSDTPPNNNSDNQASGDSANGAGAPMGGAPSLRVLAQYLKDHSFENPRAPASFQDSGPAPGIEVNVDVNARGLGPSQYEVELAVSVRAAKDKDVVFVVETTYAGVFEILNIPENQIEPILLVMMMTLEPL